MTSAQASPLRRVAVVAACAAVVFLACADRTFAFRVAGMNVRVAQVALFACAVAWAIEVGREGVRRALTEARGVAVCAAALAAASIVTIALADAPDATFVRAGWLAFNVVASAGFAAWATRRGALAHALAAGISAVAAVIWIDAFAVHWFGAEPVLGGAQPGHFFEGVLIARPHAFFYEPSYAAGALVLGVAATLGPGIADRRVAVGGAALVLSAVVLTTSRAGIVAAIVALVLAGVLVLAARAAQGASRVLREVGLSCALAGVLLVAWSAHPGGARSLRSLAGPLGWESTKARLAPVLDGGASGVAERVDRALGTPEPSMTYEEQVLHGRGEIGRLAGLIDGLRAWRRAPWFGSGASYEADVRRRSVISPGAIGGWTGLLAEWGGVGAALFGAFWIALARVRGSCRGPAGRVLLAVLAAHFGVTLVLGPSHVRLDYTLLVAGALVAYGGRAASPERADSAPAASPERR